MENEHKMLEKSLVYPQRDGWRTVLIGGLLTIFGFLVIPAFIVYGYTIRVLRSAALNEKTTPRFENGTNLFVDGLKATGISVAYIIVPYMVVFIALFGGIFMARGNDSTGAVVAVLLALIALVGFVFLFVAAYVLPVALTNFALEDRFGAAFEFRTIANAAFSRDYAVAVLISLGIGFVVGFVFFIIFFIISAVFQFVFFAVFTTMIGGGGDPNAIMGISLITGIISLIVFFVLFAVVAGVGFYVQVVTYYLLGRGSGTTLVNDSQSMD